jgi:hypothetical protein
MVIAGYTTFRSAPGAPAHEPDGADLGLWYGWRSCWVVRGLYDEGWRRYPDRDVRHVRMRRVELTLDVRDPAMTDLTTFRDPPQAPGRGRDVLTVVAVALFVATLIAVGYGVVWAGTEVGRAPRSSGTMALTTVQSPTSAVGPTSSQPSPSPSTSPSPSPSASPLPSPRPTATHASRGGAPAVPSAPTASTASTAAPTAWSAPLTPTQQLQPQTATPRVPQPCPCSLFPADAAPAVPDAGDAQPVEVGVRFSSSVDVSVIGVRFYKSAQNTGVHTGTLWAASGQELATGTFLGETPSGWQTLRLAAPVALSAGQEVVASYHAPDGHYAGDVDYFTADHSAGPLTARGGSNGVYTRGTNRAFPTSSFRSTNYWVDVLVVPT